MATARVITCQTAEPPGLVEIKLELGRDEYTDLLFVLKEVFEGKLKGGMSWHQQLAIDVYRGLVRSRV